jgi:hypothetical protein
MVIDCCVDKRCFNIHSSLAVVPVSLLFIYLFTVYLYSFIYGEFNVVFSTILIFHMPHIFNRQQFIYIIIIIILLAFTTHLRVLASSFLTFRDHTQGRTTVGRTPLDEGSARRKDLFLSTHNTYNRQTSMPPAGFEPAIPAGERL